MLLARRVDDGLVLVDTDIGTKDHSEPSDGVRVLRRLTWTFGTPDQTAINHVIGLGYSARDVRHIVMTHLHIDRAGGLSAFDRAHADRVKLLPAHVRVEKLPALNGTG